MTEEKGSFSFFAYPRLLGFSIVLVTGAIFAVAMSLEAAVEGVGTHHQLGLSPCNFLALTGIPCPGCGMTTTFTHLAHGNIRTGFGTQPFGAVLFFGMVWMFLLGLWDLLLGRQAVKRFLDALLKRQKIFFLFFFSGMFLGWVFKIAGYNFGF
jgi:hypothetical protein